MAWPHVLPCPLFRLWQPKITCSIGACTRGRNKEGSVAVEPNCSFFTTAGQTLGDVRSKENDGIHEDMQ